MWQLSGIESPPSRVVPSSQMINLGGMTECPDGVNRNNEIAFDWCKMTAEQGNAMRFAKSRLQVNECQGVIQDYKLTLEWYRKCLQWCWVTLLKGNLFMPPQESLSKILDMKN